MAPIDRIHWVQNSPTPYCDYLFRELAQNLPIPIEFYFTAQRSPIGHRWETPLRTGYVSRVYFRRMGIDWAVVSAVLRDRDSLFVTNCWQDPTSVLLGMLLAITGRPYVLWTDTPVEQGHGRNSAVKRFLRKHLLRALFRRSAAVMGTGTMALSALLRMGCPESKLVNFPNFVDLSEFRPHSSGPDRPMRFCSSGRLIQAKGFDIALRALAQVFGPGEEFVYEIAGCGPEEHGLKSLAAELGISDRVRFLGWLEPHQLPAFYESGILLHPARFEAYGVTILEAMASGLVVIASNQTGAAVDRIDDGRNGLLCHADDLGSSLAAAIRRVVEASTSERNSMGARARETSAQWPAARAVEIISALAGMQTVNQYVGPITSSCNPAIHIPEPKAGSGP